MARSRIDDWPDWVVAPLTVAVIVAGAAVMTALSRVLPETQAAALAPPVLMAPVVVGLARARIRRLGGWREVRRFDRVLRTGGVPTDAPWDRWLDELDRVPDPARTRYRQWWFLGTAATLGAVTVATIAVALGDLTDALATAGLLALLLILAAGGLAASRSQADRAVRLRPLVRLRLERGGA